MWQSRWVGHEVTITGAERTLGAKLPKGTPPGTAIGGASRLAKDAVAYIPVDLAPGEYALICFVPEMKDGKAHYVHGLLKAFTVT